MKEIIVTGLCEKEIKIITKDIGERVEMDINGFQETGDNDKNSPQSVIS